MAYAFLSGLTGVP
ncbi:uncharacterized protein FFFS_15990 [Fusarium fujikuroi]|nr:uncharacterized protein FFFS_15990 [Fusarium fujikuroi]